jgi:hypothetical protein
MANGKRRESGKSSAHLRALPIRPRFLIEQAAAVEAAMNQGHLDITTRPAGFAAAAASVAGRRRAPLIYPNRAAPGR